MGFRATLTFRKFKVALNTMHKIVLNIAKSYILSCLSKLCSVLFATGVFILLI